MDTKAIKIAALKYKVSKTSTNSNGFTTSTWTMD